MTATSSTAVQDRSKGLGYFWAGIAICLLGIALAVVQYSLKMLIAPWYVPVLATLGALLLLRSMALRRSATRLIGLVLVAALAGFEWYFVVSLAKLPEYQGPAR